MALFLAHMYVTQLVKCVPYLCNITAHALSITRFKWTTILQYIQRDESSADKIRHKEIKYMCALIEDFIAMTNKAYTTKRYSKWHGKSQCDRDWCNLVQSLEMHAHWRQYSIDADAITPVMRLALESLRG